MPCGGRTVQAPTRNLPGQREACPLRRCTDLPRLCSVGQRPRRWHDVGPGKGKPWEPRTDQWSVRLCRGLPRECSGVGGALCVPFMVSTKTYAWAKPHRAAGHKRESDSG